MDLDKYFDENEFIPIYKDTHELKRDIDTDVAFYRNNYSEEVNDNRPPRYRGVDFEGFEPFLAKHYADARPVGWDVLITDHERGDTMQALSRLLRKYVMQADEELILPCGHSLKLDVVIDEIEDNPIAYLGKRDIGRLESFIASYSFDYAMAGHNLRRATGEDIKTCQTTPSPLVPNGVEAYGDTYRGAPFQPFQFYVMSCYPGSSRQMGWWHIISHYEQGDAFYAFYCLLREYVEVWKAMIPGCV